MNFSVYERMLSLTFILLLSSASKFNLNCCVGKCHIRILSIPISCHTRGTYLASAQQVGSTRWDTSEIKIDTRTWIINKLLHEMNMVSFCSTCGIQWIDWQGYTHSRLMNISIWPGICDCLKGPNLFQLEISIQPFSSFRSSMAGMERS